MGHNRLRAKSCFQRSYARHHSGTYTVSALTMMGWLQVRRKVRCHKSSVDFSLADTRG